MWYQGLALFSFAKVTGFEETVRAALARGIEMRILLMHPDNPALGHMMREFTTNYVETIRNEITGGAEFWGRMSAHGALTLRFQKKGVMFGMLQKSDSRTMFTQYSLSRPTGESPTILAPAGTPFDDSVKADFEWQWDHAEPAL